MRGFVGVAALGTAAWLTLAACGCTVKAVGDPNRPITINANVVIDIRGLKQSAANIEDMVSSQEPLNATN